MFFLLFFVAGCAYFNTFFNAKARYNDAEKEQKKNKSETVSSTAKKGYTDAITKCWKLIDLYGDSSTYADDALLLIGKSHYHLQEYGKAERVLQQFLANYRSSEFVPNAKLWIARTYIELEKDDEALSELDNIAQYKISKEIASESFYILGDLYYKREKYDQAIENFLKSTDLTSDDEKEGRGYFYLGESFMAMNQYENAISNYDKVKKLDVPILLEFEALIQKINALVELKKYEDATDELEEMLSDNRFKEYYSLIETKLALISEYEDHTDYAMERYHDVITKYNKSEGAALAAFYIGQIYEYEIGRFDSAKIYYDKVKSLYPKSDANEEAIERSKMLSEYLKIREKLDKDIKDHFKLMRGDSVLVDSIEIVDKKEEEPEKDNVSTDSGRDRFSDLALEENSVIDKNNTDQDSTQQIKTAQPKNKAKEAVSRDPHLVYASLVKNTYALGEYFLLKYQHNDSAKAVFKHFVDNYQDSLLTPKAYYTLYYIYTADNSNKHIADSLKELITKNYPQSAYAQKFKTSNKHKYNNTNFNSTDSLSKSWYLEAEYLLDLADYNGAIEKLELIATLDSSSVWAAKSRYAMAYIYECYLDDIPNAIENYSIITRDFPKTKYSSIAENKIKQPPPEIVSDLSDSTITETPGPGGEYRID